MLSDQDAAYAAAAWVSGTSQRELAWQFRTRQPVISRAIRAFVETWNPETQRHPALTKWGPGLSERLNGDERNALVLQALGAFCQARAPTAAWGVTIDVPALAERPPRR